MNMSLKNLAKTYPWTQDAANAAINKFQGGATEACIIMPTGSGKTISSSLVIDALFKGQTILYLAPSWAILNQTKERYTSHGFMNIYYMTYMMMMRSVKRNKTFTIKPDLIITDEFHRLGALEWGESLGSYPENISGHKSSRTDRYRNSVSGRWPRYER
jgi:superfamily II DNA or RNA helicase